MKVRLEVELDLHPLNAEKGLTAKEEKMIAGMMRRLVLGRVRALNGAEHGGEKAETGWEVLCTNVDVNIKSRQK